jgi:hypothetical protein
MSNENIPIPMMPADVRGVTHVLMNIGRRLAASKWRQRRESVLEVLAALETLKVAYFEAASTENKACGVMAACDLDTLVERLRILAGEVKA